jgi:hypothetical protein
MSDETKTPQPGEWWVDKNDFDIAYFIGKAPCGQMVWQCAGDDVEVGDLDWSGWRHEPRCDSFDWVEPPAIDPGEGWELLPVGTVLEECDEALHSGKWYRTIYAGMEYREGDGNIYRRKIKPAIDPGEGYELLLVGTVLEKGDQVQYETMTGKAWCDTVYAGERIGDAVHRMGPYRRKIKPPAEVWPKWHVPTETIISHRSESPVAYFRRDQAYKRDEKNGETFLADGTSFTWNDWTQDGTAIEVTEAEALARVTPSPEFCSICGVHFVVTGTKACRECTQYAIETTGCPVDSPDDWVEITDPSHMPRDGVDWFNGGSNNSWIVHEARHVRSTLGEYQKSWCGGKFRCRRKDLPAKQPATKRVPVRMWVHRDSRNDDRYNVFAKISPPDHAELYTEILHDADGFYVEVSE